MTFNEFVTKYEGKTVGYPDGSFVGECLSLVKVYMKETLGFNPPPSGSNSAYGYWSNFPKPLGDYYTKNREYTYWHTKEGRYCYLEAYSLK